MVGEKLLNTISFSTLNIWDVKRFGNIAISYNKNYTTVPFSKVLKESNMEWVTIQDDVEYPILGVRTYGKGVYINRTSKGKELKMRKYQKSQKDHLFWCKVDTKNGAFGVITQDFENTYGSSNMSYLKISTNKISLNYLQLLFQTIEFNKYMDNLVVGVTNRKYISKNDLLSNIFIPLPTLEEQHTLVEKYENTLAEAVHCEKEVERLEASIEEYLFSVLGVEKKQPIPNSSSILKTIGFKKLMQWGYDKNGIDFPYTFSNFPAFSIYDKPKWCISLTRGRSPKYSDSSNNFVLNQKCNRWDEIDLSYTKGVDTLWLSKVSRDILTEKDDILINSTGEGTLGRASLIKNQAHIGLLYDSHMLCLRVNINFVNPQLLVFLINSSFGQAQIEMLKGAQATKQTELGIDNMKKILFPLPEINIQNQIADHITEIKEQIKALRQEAESLRERAKREFEEAVFSQ